MTTSTSTPMSNNAASTRCKTVSLKCYKSEYDLWKEASAHYTEGGKFSEMAREALTRFSVELLENETGKTEEKV